MTAHQALALLPGDRVIWARDHRDLGTITEVCPYAIVIAWDNGIHGTLHPEDMDNVHTTETLATRDALAAIGRIGGRSMSEKKIAAIMKNIKLATAARKRA